MAALIRHNSTPIAVWQTDAGNHSLTFADGVLTRYNVDAAAIAPYNVPKAPENSITLKLTLRLRSADEIGNGVIAQNYQPIQLKQGDKLSIVNGTSEINAIITETVTRYTEREWI